MTRAALQPKKFRALQSGKKRTPKLNPVKKFKKFFSASLAILLFISPVFAEETFLIPPASGTLIDSYRFQDFQFAGNSDTPLIVHIQDAHGSLAVQRNIVAVIGFLVRHYGFRAVYEEGNVRKIETRKVFWMPERIRLDLAGHFLKEGKITGAEFAHVTGDQSFELFGAEMPALYEKNLRLRRQMLSYRPVAEGYLANLEKAVSRQASRVFSKDLRHYLRDSEHFWKGRGKVPFHIRPLKEGTSPDKFLARLKELDAAARDRKVKNSAEKKEIEKLELVSVMRRVAFLEASREDLEYYASHRDEVVSLIRGKAVLEEYFRLADLFYEVARRRDRAMIRKMLDGMAARHETRVILVSGGFHSLGMTELLKKRGVAYAVIAPVAFPAAAHTVREPNLLNLPGPEARLLTDLRGMEMTREENPVLYNRLKKDALRLRRRIEHSRVLLQPELPAGIVKAKAVILLPLDPINSEVAAGRMIHWVYSLARANETDFVLLFRRRADVQSLRRFLRENIKEVSVRDRIHVSRLLTPGDFESVQNFLQERYSFLFGGRAEMKRLELGGIKVNQFLPLKTPQPSGARGLLYDEIERLQLNHRAFVTSA